MATVDREAAQVELLEETAPAEVWDRDVAKHALDELFSMARAYRTGAEYRTLLEFTRRFHFYAPFNALLLHIQRPGAAYVAPAHKWLYNYSRTIKPGANPLVILQPMGPVMFVFDVSDTEPLPKAPPLPREVTDPFGARRGYVGGELTQTIENAKRDGIGVFARRAGSQSAGQIAPVQSERTLQFQVRWRPEPKWVSIPQRYEVLLNADHAPADRYATLVHELAHLYCGHLGTPDPLWWPDRRGLTHEVEEFEAESVCHLVCSRLGIEAPSDRYLSAYLDSGREMPPISLECVMKAAGLVEQMGRESLSQRKERKAPAAGMRS